MSEQKNIEIQYNDYGEIIDVDAVDGPVVSTFFKFVIPSTLSLLAISTAAVVDGFFVGKYIGEEALASVNLLVPYFGLLFGLALMLAVGGSVKASIAIGKRDVKTASNIYSQVFFSVLAFNLIALPISLYFSDSLFIGLGADRSLFDLMNQYFVVLAPAIVIQLCGLVCYYFFRADNKPQHGMKALILGAITNICLNTLFIGYLGYGIQAAAWATLCAEVVQLLYIFRYFKIPNTNLKLYWPKFNFKTLVQSGCNGFSEFINETSIGFVILVFHWVINLQSGIQGIAAFSVINYFIYISLMVYYGIVDSMHVLLGQNFGAHKIERVVKFMQMAGACIATLTVVQICILFSFEETLVNFFLEDGATKTQALTLDFIHIVWPIFLFSGFNVLASAYLTSAELALQSSVIASLRSLFLPIGLVLLFYIIFDDNNYLYAIPIAEGLTFIIAMVLFYMYSPRRLTPPEE